MRRAIGTALVVLLVVTAGCLGGISGDLGTSDGPDDAGDGSTADGGDGTATDGGSAESVDGPAGTVNFYVSDQPNDMDDFESLNVTITEVRFHLVDDAANGSEDGNETATVTTTESNETATTTDTSTATATETATVTTTLTANPDESAENEAGDETPAGSESESGEDEVEDEEEEVEADEESEDEEKAGDGNGRWVTREVNETTVDLTELRGANATMLEQFDLPAGEYNNVVLEVSETNGTLTNGESTEVKLPSEKLQLKMDFTVADGSEVDFVYDVTVKKAGKSGKYILRPVVSESGTDQEINRVDVDEDDDERESLNVRFEGQIAAGQNATVKVSQQGDPVENATVSLDGESVGTTDADGTLTVAIPADAEEVEVEVTAGDAEGELERDLQGDESSEENDEKSDDGQVDDDQDGDSESEQGADNGQGDGASSDN